jgi:hypothetical protein
MSKIVIEDFSGTILHPSLRSKQQPNANMEAHVTKITIGRLYNLGSYEHVRYEIAVDVPVGQSAATTLIGLERIMEALAPESKACVHTEGELDREQNRVLELQDHLLKLTEEEFRHKHGWFEGTPKDYCERIEKSHEEERIKRQKWEKRARKARMLLYSLGGAANWKDAKLDWENDDDFEM